MGVTVLYADAACAVCVKPAGAESQRQMPTLLAECLPGPFYPVHRLDRETGGVMVYARTREAAADLSRQMAAHAVRKRYLAVVRGCPDPPEGRWEDWLFHDAARNKTYRVDRPRKGVKQAALSYRVHTVGQVEGASATLVEVTLETGRTHQIRAQFAGRGFPLAGDRKYGGPKRPDGLALWAWELTLTLPSGRMRTFTAPPPWGVLFFSVDSENIS